MSTSNYPPEYLQPCLFSKEQAVVSPFPCVEALYATCFNYLRRSARFWRKERGPNGYLKFISERLPG